MNKSIYILLAILLWGCNEPPKKTDKYQYKRDNIITIKNKIKEINIDNLLFSSACDVHIINDYLLIADYRASDHLINIFNKNTFKYMTSIGYLGQGPGEISNMGTIGIDNTHRKFNVTDYGKQKIFSYYLDSILTNPNYIPEEKLKIHEEKTLSQYKYINDTLCIGIIMEPNGSSSLTMTIGIQNMNTGYFKAMPYVHPDIKKKSVFFDASTEYGIYVESYIKQNLITICTLEGELKYNIYGSRNWEEDPKGRFEYYQQVAFVGNKIFVLYLNDDGYVQDPAKGIIGNLATKFLVLDIKGDYIATLETGRHIGYFCYDKENNRIILNMNDEIQFGYLDLEGLIDVGR